MSGQQVGLQSSFTSRLVLHCSVGAGVFMYEIWTKAMLPYDGWHNQKVGAIFATRNVGIAK